jgi:VanZ family protein
MTSDARRLLQIIGVTAIVSLVLATLLPTKFIPRTGLGWENEHFLMYFAATTILSIASRRPLLVALSLMACSGVLEALQGLTPDRFPDLTAALAGTAGVISAATMVMLLIRARRSLVLLNWIPRFSSFGWLATPITLGSTRD